MIDVLRGFGIRGLITDDPGVWVEPLPSSSSSSSKSESGLNIITEKDEKEYKHIHPLPKKITAVGVHLRRNISSYGIGFNVSEEPMWYFGQIVPCGLEGREATSLEAMGVKNVGVDDIADRFVSAFVNRLNGDYQRQNQNDASHEKEKVEVYRVEGVDDIYNP